MHARGEVGAVGCPERLKPSAGNRGLRAIGRKRTGLRNQLAGIRSAATFRRAERAPASRAGMEATV